MSPRIVLITGANGHIGFEVVVTALEEGYHVRAAVRSQNKADKILNAPSIKALDPKKSETVITSSVLAQLTWRAFAGEETDKVFTETSRTPDPAGPFHDDFAAYAASKVRELNATERWMKEQNPHFSLVHIHPSWVLGKDELVTSADDFSRGTNKAAFAQVLRGGDPGPVPSNPIVLENVAHAHIKALDPNIPNAQSLLTTLGGVDGAIWSDAIDIVKTRFPKAVSSGILPATGHTKSKIVKFDSSHTQKLLGMNFKPYEDQVVDIAMHYLELVGAPAA